MTESNQMKHRHLETPISSLTVANDASSGDWIAPRLRGEFGAVTLSVPSGFPAYVRICHPAQDTHGKIVKWSEVAQATGRTAHSLMQWHALVGSSDSNKFKGSLWDGRAPERGNLALPQLQELCELLDAYTTDAKQCFMGLWTGWAWVGGSDVVTTRMWRDSLHRALLKLPDRDYVLLMGLLADASKIRNKDCAKLSVSQSPNILWPADHAWFVASEIDFDSTLVGGSDTLIKSILEMPGLDAWQVGPDDSLAFDADKVNHVVVEEQGPT